MATDEQQTAKLKGEKYYGIVTNRRGGGHLVPMRPGEKRGGIKKGQHHRTTRLLKEAILLAAKDYGEDGKGKGELAGFLRKVIKEDLKGFVTLLGKVLPLQITGKDDAPEVIPYKAYSEAIEDLREEGLAVVEVEYEEIDPHAAEKRKGRGERGPDVRNARGVP